MTLHHFHGGLKLPSNKDISTQQSIADVQIPAKVILPVRQHIGNAAVADVEVGDHVFKGQTIAPGNGYVSAPIHASISGTVTAIEERPIAHPSGLSALCIEIESDGKDEWHPDLPAPVDNYRQLDAVELRNLIREAGIVGLGGAAFPTAVKLNPPHQTTIQTLVLNAAECEPYISCDDMLMRENADQILQGITILQHLLKPEQTIVGIEDNKPEAIASLQQALDNTSLSNTQIQPVPTIYPTGGERQLIKVLTGKEVPSHGLPADIGIVCQNIGTVFSIYQAVIEGIPLIERVVTITGAGVEQPQNMRSRIGTLMSDLTTRAGGYTSAAERLVLGGPMMGISLQTDQLPITKSANCLLVTSQSEIPQDDSALPCIRCGRCADACPAQLLPQQLYWHASSRNFDKIQDHNLFDCIECGCCAYVCPSKIPLVQYYRFAKTEIWKEERQSNKSNQARERHEFRQERLERQKREKEERLARKREALKAKTAKDENDPKQAAIKAAMERAKARKAKREGAVPEDSGNNDELEEKQAAIKAAMERAKARKAKRQTGENDGKPARKKPELTPEQQAKIDAAKARKQQEPGETGSTDSSDEQMARIKAAMERAKARKAKGKAKTEGGTDQPAKEKPESAVATADIAEDEAEKMARVKAAMERAKARKAKKNSGDKPKPETLEKIEAETAAKLENQTDAPSAESAEDEAEKMARIKAAMERAKARKAKRNKSETDAEAKPTGSPD